MRSRWDAATRGWRRRVFHYPPQTLMSRNFRLLCAIELQPLSLTPLKMRKVQLRSGIPSSPLVNDAYIVSASDSLILRVGNIFSFRVGSEPAWRGAVSGPTVGPFRLPHFPEAVVDPRPQSVWLRVVALKQLNVTVDVSKDLSPLRCRQLGVHGGAVALTHGMVRVQFDGSRHILDAPFRVKYRRNLAGVCPSVPVDGTLGSS